MFHMIIGQVFVHAPLEKYLSPLDLYKGVTEGSMIHVFDLVMTYYQLVKF